MVGVSAGLLSSTTAWSVPKEMEADGSVPVVLVFVPKLVLGSYWLPLVDEWMDVDPASSTDMWWSHVRAARWQGWFVRD